jgi:phage-related protein
LKSRDRAAADQALDLLADRGSELRMPSARPLGGGLSGLRFTCEGTARRVRYYIASQRVIIILTTFREQRHQERRELARAQGTDG